MTTFQLRTIGNAGHGQGESSSRLCSLAAAFTAAWFLVHTTVYATLSWGYCHGVTKFLLWQSGSFVVLLLAAAILRPLAAGPAIGIQMAVSTAVLLAYSHDAIFVARFAVILLWAFCAAGGMRRALAWVGPRYATWGVAAAAVLAALVPLCFFSGFFHLLRFWIVLSLALGTALPGAVLAVIGGIRRRRWLRVKRAILRLGILELCWLEAIWIILMIAMVGASGSELRSDSVRVHLPYIHQVVQDGGISHQYACWHRLQPMAAQCCYAAFAVLGGDAAAKWLSWLALLALVVLVADEVRQRSGSRRLALFAAAAVLSCPVLVDLATTLYVDHVITLFCTAGFVVLFRSLQPPCWRGILLSAAIMASMVQVKYNGLIFAAIWCVMLLGTLLRRCAWQTALGWSLVAALVLVVAAAPWYVYVYAGTGNPVFPHLHNLFPSPYWSDTLSVQKVFAEEFKMPPGIAGAFSFPWTATFQTKRFVEGHDGCLGFWAVALLPCCFFVGRGMTRLPWRDLVFAGVVAIAGVVLYTPYVRYWLPGYPLLVAGCVLAAAALARPWNLQRPLDQAAIGLSLGLVLLLPLPLHFPQFAWCDYEGKLSRDERLERSFPGYAAVKDLNRMLGPDDGVLCTGFEGVCLVGGRPYEFAFWWNEAHHIDSVPAFASFCRRNNIRYWVVDRAQTAAREGLTGEIQSRYWTDARMVAAHGTVAVYDVTSRSSHVAHIASRYDR